MGRRTKGSQIEELREKLERARLGLEELAAGLDGLAATIDTRHNETLEGERIERDFMHVKTCTRCESVVALRAMASFALGKTVEVDAPAPAVEASGYVPAPEPAKAKSVEGPVVRTYGAKYPGRGAPSPPGSVVEAPAEEGSDG